MANVNIERLEIRVKGISSQAARSAVVGLDAVLAKKLMERSHLLKETGTININNIDVGTFRTEGNSTSSELREIIAEKIVGSLSLQRHKDAKR